MPRTPSPVSHPDAAFLLTETLELVDIASLRPHPRNDGRHPPDEIAHLKASLAEHGIDKNVVVANDGTILTGHGVVQAARELGYTQIPVQRKAYGPDHPLALKRLVGDNHIAALRQRDDAILAALLTELAQDDPAALLGTGFDEAMLAALVEAQGTLGGGDGEDHAGRDAEPQVDRAEELQAEWGTALGQIWACGQHRVACGDCTDKVVVERLLNGVVPVLMVTDPPYGVEYDANWRNEAAANGYIAHAAGRVGKVVADDRVDWRSAWELFPGDVVYCWHAGRHASTVQMSLEACSFEMRCQIIWAKQVFAISRGHYHWQHEPCWYAVRKGATASWIGDHSQTTLWSIQWDKNVEEGHSTQKPLECMARAIRNHDAPFVYDPFLGSGTTLVACESLGRRCYGAEISPAYTAVCLQRYYDLVGERPVLLES